MLWIFDSARKYSKDYARLQMKRRLQKTGESLQEYAFEIQKLTILAFSEFSANVRETISLQYFMDGLRDEEIQRAERTADVQDLKSALKFEAVTQASCIDRHSIQGARMGADVPCESPWLKEINKLRKQIQDLLAQPQNLRRRITCWGCGGAGHLRSSCPRITKDRNIQCWGCNGTGHVRNNCHRAKQKDPHCASVIKSKKVCSTCIMWEHLSNE
ncbi:uncharacterized protein TNCV_3609081 [Trichonephila clavipes]|nr:uncharacterized protein TNCV_3609081 [Trichonephila clavipes]